MTAVVIGHTQLHPPVPGFAVCCSHLPNGGACTWHADAVHDTDREGRPAVRAAAVAHARTGHRVLFNDATAAQFIEGLS